MSDRPPPYPADTRAKGWRFELAYEQIEQSDTWDLAAEIPLCQHILLMMWLIAWKQEPCGSLPNDEGVIRAKCKVPPKTWAACRGVLMRGWWLAVDGRLYHNTLADRVQEMLDYRRKNAERVAKFKAAQREQRGSNALPAREQRAKNDTGTGTGVTPHKPPRGATAVGLKTWLEAIKTEGEKPVPSDDPVFAYAEDVGIPPDFLRLAWLEFRHHYTQTETKRYRDWRAVFCKAVRSNWLKLWWVDGDQYRLTTRGEQAKRAHQDRTA